VPSTPQNTKKETGKPTIKLLHYTGSPGRECSRQA